MENRNDEDRPRNRIDSWFRLASQLEELVTRLGRFPTHEDFLGADARDLETWVWHQRRRELTVEQSVRLSDIPGFSWDPLHDAWLAKLTEYATFVAEYERAPRYRSPDAQERRLADWFARQRRLASGERLPYQRAALLREFLDPLR